MNILIVHNYYKIPGGEDTVVQNEMALLRSKGHKVIFYKRSNEELEKYHGLKKVILPFKIMFSIRTFRDIKKIIKEEKIDIVHVHNTVCVVSPSVYYAAFSLKKPVVQTIHNFRLLCPGATLLKNGKICEECIQKNLFHACKYNCYRDSKMNTFAIALMTTIHKFIGTYRKISYICLTDFNKNKLLEINTKADKYIKSSQVYVKPNFTDYNSEIVPWEKRKNQVVYAGRLDKTKGIEIMLEAWKSVKDIELIVCGIGPESEWCKSFIEKNGVNNVKLQGFVNHEQVMDIISESKALILLTQWYEGFPMVIAESFACGTQVIGSGIGNVGSLILDGVNGKKVNQNSIESIVEAVNNLEDLTKSTKECSDDLYSMEKNYDKLIDIYMESLKF
ncbi:MAG: glycosyltransferase family 4 protein [Lachnospiraceae bacterium]|nr:glycosyltransferase family 4 protein [Lachnospiraceae bacterium]